MTRFFTAQLVAIGNTVLGFELPGVDGVVSYSTAIRLNLRFLRVFGLTNQINEEIETSQN